MRRLDLSLWINLKDRSFNDRLSVNYVQQSDVILNRDWSKAMFKAIMPSWIYSNAGAVAKMASLFINLFRMSAHPSLHAI